MDTENLPQAALDAAREQLDALRRGTVRIYTEEELLSKLARAAAEDRPLRVKLGMDPTAPDLHLGHTVVMNKMRQFQDMGHKAVLIIGDYTARVGDPSGQDHTRPILSDAEIDANAKTYFEQAGKILDTRPEKCEIRPNGEWLAKLSFADTLKLAASMTVARMLERDSFERRYKAGDPIGVHEFLYPLMQAYDSVVIEADVELGGTDQTFNCLAGRELQRDADAEPQVVVTMPLLVGTDGSEKMSKSKGNYVGVSEPPGDMFGKLMSIPDELMEDYWTLLTTRPLEEVREMLSREHPREAKERLARTIVARFHDEEAAEAAAEEFRRVFSRQAAPSDAPEVHLDPSELHREGDRVGLPSVITAAGFASSNGEAMRLIKQGAVRLDDEVIDDTRATLDPEEAAGSLLRVGRKKWATLQFDGGEG